MLHYTADGSLIRLSNTCSERLCSSKTGVIDHSFENGYIGRISHNTNDVFHPLRIQESSDISNRHVIERFKNKDENAFEFDVCITIVQQLIKDKKWREKVEEYGESLPSYINMFENYSNEINKNVSGIHEAVAKMSTPPPKQVTPLDPDAPMSSEDKSQLDALNEQEQRGKDSDAQQTANSLKNMKKDLKRMVTRAVKAYPKETVKYNNNINGYREIQTKLDYAFSRIPILQSTIDKANEEIPIVENELRQERQGYSTVYGDKPPPQQQSNNVSSNYVFRRGGSIGATQNSDDEARARQALEMQYKIWNSIEEKTKTIQRLTARRNNAQININLFKRYSEDTDAIKEAMQNINEKIATVETVRANFMTSVRNASMIV